MSIERLQNQTLRNLTIEVQVLKLQMYALFING